MQGQKSIAYCFAIILFVLFISIYKPIVKRDRERAQLLKRRQQEAEQKKEHELFLTMRKHKHDNYVRKMLEYNDKCYDIHALIFKPKIYDKIWTMMTTNNNNDNNFNQSDTTHSGFVFNNIPADAALVIKDCTNNNVNKKKQSNQIVNNNKHIAGGCVVDSIISNSISYIGSDTVATTTSSEELPSLHSNQQQVKPNGKIMEKISESSSSIIYVFILILLVSLIKALFDLSKQFKEVCQSFYSLILLFFFLCY